MKKLKVCLMSLLIALVAISGSAIMFKSSAAEVVKEYTVSNTTEFNDALKADTTETQKIIYVKEVLDYNYIVEAVGQILVRPLSNDGNITINCIHTGNYFAPKTPTDTLAFERIDFNLTGGNHDSLFRVLVGSSLYVKDSKISFNGGAVTVDRPIYGAGTPLPKVVLENVDFSNVTVIRGFCFRADTTITGNTKVASGTQTASGGIITDFTATDITASGTTQAVLACSGDVKRGANTLASKIFYTTDGSDPTKSGIEYIAPITIPATSNFVIKAVLAADSNKYFGKTYEFKYNEVAAVPDVSATDLPIDYVNQTITFKAEIEANAKVDFSGEPVVSGANILPGATIYARYKATQTTQAGNVFTLNIASAPAAPAITSAQITANSITLADIPGGEYKINTAAEYQASPVFEGLVTGVEYTFNARIKATSSAFVSAVAESKFSTLTEFGNVVAADYTIDYNAEKFSFEPTVEANISADFTGAAVETNSLALPNSKVYIRYKQTASLSAGPISELTFGARATTPDAIKLLSKNNTSFTIVKNSGCEYKIGEWQDSNIFSGLSASTDYTVSMRVKATATNFASEAIQLLVTTGDSANEIAYVSNFSELKAVLSSDSPNTKITYITTSFELTDEISLIGKNIVTPQGEGVIKLDFTIGGRYVFNVRANSDSQFKNIHINQTVESGVATIYFNDKPTGATLGNGIIRLDNCVIDRVNEFRVFHPAFNGSKIYLNNSTINGAGVSIYRGTCFLYGTTTYNGTVSSSAVVYDYRDVNVVSSMDSNFMVSLSVSKAPTKGGVAIEDAKIYYTTDGTDPLVSTTKQEYTQPIAVSGIINLTYTIISAESSLNISKNEYFFKYVINYLAETMTFEDSIQLSETNDFASLITSGAKISAGSTIYGRETANQSNIFSFSIADRVAAPTLALSVKTDTQLQFEANSLCEYAINSEAFGEASVFTGLTKNTEYTVKCRLKATLTTFASQETAVSVTTMGKKATITQADLTLDFDKKVIKFDASVEVNTSANFGGATKIASSSAITNGAVLYARFVGDKRDVAGDYITITLPALPAKVDSLTFTSDLYTITLQKIDGLEYKIGEDGDWQDASEFVGLAADTEYVFYARVKATDTAFASQETEVMASTTKAVVEKEGCKSAINSSYGLVMVVLILACCVILLKKKKA